MANTATWALPYPGGGDPPAGNAQLQALAEATDTALTQVSTRYPPWVLCGTGSLGLVIGANGLMPMTISSQHASNVFSLSANALLTSRAGMYSLMFTLRCGVSSGTPTTGGYLQVGVEHPVGTELWNAGTLTFGEGTVMDLIGGGLVRLTAATALQLRVTNQSGANQSLPSVGRIHLVWVGD